MRNLLVICLLFFAQKNFAQAGEQISLNTDNIKSPELLARVITSSDTTDLQKVTSIFKWITENIDYNVTRFENNSTYRYAQILDDEDEDSSAPIKPLYERVAIQVLKRRTAVCGGYANLFKALCTHVGIKCEVITGLGKASAGRLDKRFTSNHRWNAVFFDSSWHLLDVTWATGYVNYKDQFERFYNPNYFLTSPKEFIKDHYPEDARWTLLPNLPMLNEFFFSPFKMSAFNRYYIRSYTPVSGVINARVGDSVVFEIDADRPDHLWISDLTYADSTSVFAMQYWGIKQKNVVNGTRISAGYKVVSPNIEWLSIIYDDEIIMRYKLNVKKENSFVQNSSLLQND